MEAKMFEFLLIHIGVYNKIQVKWNRLEFISDDV
jgi:hypothetical protein